MEFIFALFFILLVASMVYFTLKQRKRKEKRKEREFFTSTVSTRKVLLQIAFLIFFGVLLIFAISVLKRLDVLNDLLLICIVVFGLTVATLVGRNNK
ncbi:hypothetical protein [uncultured Pontibacter sp.]|uniref:hypothetical protein n=1 Tax=uncultured Pontibacter sp. TaxID=453356 RepID=UPI0026305EA5|nr:hypothetical protein [uncultured Pontibacter sp.]